MLKIKTIPVIMRITSKLDLAPVIAAVKELNDFKPADNTAEAAQQLAERKVELGLAVIGSITPQLGAISDDIVELIASYEGVSLEEAGDLDAVEEIKKIAGDAGIANFFKSALQAGNKQQK